MQKPSVFTSLHGLPSNFTHTLKICLGRFLSPFDQLDLSERPVFESPTGRSRCYGSSRELQNCKNAVNCNFSSTHFRQSYVFPKLSVRGAQICSLRRIGNKTKKVCPSKLLGRSTSVKHSRIVGTAIFLRRSYTASVPLERLRLAELKDAISAAWDVRKKITAFDRAI